MFSTLPHSILCCNHFHLGDTLRVLFVVNFRAHVVDLLFLVKHVTMQFMNYKIQQILHLRHFTLIVIMFEYI
jgi:hypothetical protein